MNAKQSEIKPLNLHPIEVLALLAGNKAQFRRSLNPQPLLSEKAGFCWKGEAFGLAESMQKTAAAFANSGALGRVGDRFWIREPAKVIAVHEDKQIIDIEYQSDNKIATVAYPSRLTPILPGASLRGGVHREASRIEIEITDFKIERIQDISPSDAMSEGVTADMHDKLWLSRNPLIKTIDGTQSQKTFKMMWDAMFGNGSWVANEWVLVRNFCVVSGRIELM